MRFRVCFGLLVFGVCLKFGESANILGFFTTFSKSHLIIHMAIVNTLIERGHNVTVVTTLPLEDKNPKYHHVKIATPDFEKNVLKDSINNPKNIIASIIDKFKLIKNSVQRMNDIITAPEIEKLEQEGSFDLVILGYFLNSEVEMGIAGHFKCPLVISFSQTGMKSIYDLVGNPIEPFYVPNIFSGFTQPMGFAERVKNFLISALTAGLSSLYKIIERGYYESRFPPDKYPAFDEMLRNVSLVLLSTHFTHGIVAPTVPAVVHIGGIHIKSKPDPLPEDIGKFLDSAHEHGAIYFSLGSNARSSELRPDTIALVYKVLSSLKYKVIWKWETAAIPGNASNILFKSWLPQDDILAHPNIKVFISHCGMGSIVESEYHGVPLVGMPLFADQFSNAKLVEESGFGLAVDYHNMTEESLRGAILDVLENSKFRNAIGRFAKLYRDRPMSPKDTAAFWLEYVIRHKGAKHMQSPAVHMNAIQYYGLDVIAFLASFLYIAYKLVVFAIKLILCKFLKKIVHRKENKYLKKNKKD